MGVNTNYNDAAKPDMENMECRTLIGLFHPDRDLSTWISYNVTSLGDFIHERIKFTTHKEGELQWSSA